jgi:metal-responsive CopG/Arc/MetJ family transcriptional regulator
LTVGITVVILSNMKTAISLPDSLFESAERLAERLGISRSEVFQRALALFLQEHSSDAITEALNQVYSADRAEAALDPALEALQIASLEADEDW